VSTTSINDTGAQHVPEDRAQQARVMSGGAEMPDWLQEEAPPWLLPKLERIVSASSRLARTSVPPGRFPMPSERPTARRRSRQTT
jgi:hypothetical protein